MSELNLTCPICGRPFSKTPLGWGCEGYKEDACKAGIFSEISGHRITEEDAKKLLDGETIGPFEFLSKKNKAFNASLKFDTNEGKVIYVFDDGPTEETSIACPVCGENLGLTEKTYKCSCGFRIFKSIAKREMAENEIRDLCETGRTMKLDGFVSKKGKEFSCALVLNDDTHQVEFDFD